MPRIHFTEHHDLPEGGELRASGDAAATELVVLAPGGTGGARAGRWSSNMAYLAPRLRRALGADTRIVELRWGNSSWRTPRPAFADLGHALTHEALTAPDDRRVVLVGFSMGGAACLANAAAPGVVGLVGIAPWLPGELPIAALRGRRLRIVHGTLDGELPLVPGLRSTSARSAVERARAAGVDASFTEVAGALHGLALPVGPLLAPMPRARSYAQRVTASVTELLRTPPFDRRS
ncbi:MAG: hypothetical protein JWN72_252 [Thermoleophilia bacterium]|nr:hypothetical protein [Thermoleophilia bacterium]